MPEQQQTGAAKDDGGHFVVTPPPRSERTTTLSPEAIRMLRAKQDQKEYAAADANCKKVGKKAVLAPAQQLS